jgi:hypothetical protein
LCHLDLLGVDVCPLIDAIVVTKGFKFSESMLPPSSVSYASPAAMRELRSVLAALLLSAGSLAPRRRSVPDRHDAEPDEIVEAEIVEPEGEPASDTPPRIAEMIRAGVFDRKAGRVTRPRPIPPVDESHRLMLSALEALRSARTATEGPR